MSELLTKAMEIAIAIALLFGLAIMAGLFVFFTQVLGS